MNTLSIPQQIYKPDVIEDVEYTDDECELCGKQEIFIKTEYDDDGFFSQYNVCDNCGHVQD